MADEKDIAEEAPSGGKKKLIIIVAGVVLLLAVGGGAAFFLLSAGDETGAGDEQDVAAVEEGDPEYYKLNPTFVVNLPPGGPAKMLQVAIQVMTYNPSVIDTLEANDPMIRHHLLNLLEGQSSATLLTVQGKEALQQSIHDVLKERLEALKEPGKIKGVFFTQFVMQ